MAKSSVSRCALSTYSGTTYEESTGNFWQSTVEILNRAKQELVSIFNGTRAAGDPSAGWDRVDRWEERIAPELAKVLPREAASLRDTGGPSNTDPMISFKDRVNAHCSFIDALVQDLQEHPEAVFANQSIARDGGEAPATGTKVFIGHGRNDAWYKVKDYIKDELHVPADYFEAKSRVGKSIVPILQEFLDEATAAVIVMTGEDVTADKSVRARQNVVQEAGLFQGRLGFERVIILEEDGVEEFSNVHGLIVIPFAKGRIDGTFDQIRRHLKQLGIVGD